MSKSQHVLVTGAGGDIGTAIVQHFLAEGATITAVDIKPESEILKHTRQQIMAGSKRLH